jgi:hypothetical protein
LRWRLGRGDDLFAELHEFDLRDATELFVTIDGDEDEFIVPDKRADTNVEAKASGFDPSR